MHFFALNAFECSHAFQHFVEVYLVTVKFRSVYTYEFGLAADGDGCVGGAPVGVALSTKKVIVLEAVR